MLMTSREIICVCFSESTFFTPIISIPLPFLLLLINYLPILLVDNENAH